VQGKVGGDRNLNGIVKRDQSNPSVEIFALKEVRLCMVEHFKRANSPWLDSSHELSLYI
jgi:hypothetical protein